MKFIAHLTMVILCLCAGAVKAEVVISGVVGNGDFEATQPAAGPETFADTPFWYNASGSETADFTVDTGTVGSPQPNSRAVVPTPAQAVNAAGHVVGAAGETFSVALSLHAWGSGSWYQGDEQVRISLFTASAPVDADLTTSYLTELCHISFIIDGTWMDHPATALYTTVDADIGKTLYMGLRLEDPTPPNPSSRLDMLELTVATGGGNRPPAFSVDPIRMPDAEEAAAYIGQTLAGSASDPEADPLTFSKIYGPAWLKVAPDGTLSGTPGAAYTGTTNSFSVQVVALGGSGTAMLDIYVEPAPVILTGWEEFVEAYGLSGFKLVDFDDDGVDDVYEFAHGGNPTNPADRGIQPHVVWGPGNKVDFICLETTHSNPGITYTPEWTDNLAGGEWYTEWKKVKATTSSQPGYNRVERRNKIKQRKQDGAVSESIFFRNRLFTFRPNILVIMADDLGYSDVGFNGSPDIITPELDTLATNGTIFTSAYVVHPFCGPSRMGLFSGRYPHTYGGPFNLPNYNSGEYTDQGIPPDETLISTVLQDAGYYTGIMGKWHMGQQPIYHPNNRGFDEFYGFLGGGHNYFGPFGKASDYRSNPEHNGVSDSTLTATNYLTDVLTDYGIRFLNEAARREGPFFLFMSYNAPHTPLQAKTEDMDMFPQISDYKRKTYAGMVYAMDRGVGRLADTLKANRQLENTLIIFLSDNGGRTDQGATNYPLRGRKGDVAEGGFRVPFFMHWPGVIPAGGRYHHPVSSIDFYPTFARLGKVEIPSGKELDGFDVWDAILSGGSGRVGKPIYTMRHNIGWGDTGNHSVGIRKDQWKAVRWTGFGESPLRWKLFNIDEDLHEDVDLSETYPEILSEMVSEAELWSQGFVTPLWYDGYEQEQMWIDRALPHYDDVFSIP